MTMLQSSMSSRNQIGAFLQEMGLTGLGVEVGTHQGHFAEALLSSWSGSLVCIDPWANPPGYEQQAPYLEFVGVPTGGDREQDYILAKQRLHPYIGRVLFLRCVSAEALENFNDEELDFVHLDGDHREKEVRWDLNMWWGKLKPGGIIAIHDFLTPGLPGPDNWGANVQPAVLEFSQSRNLYVYLIVEEGGLPWTAYMFKPIEVQQ